MITILEIWNNWATLPEGKPIVSDTFFSSLISAVKCSIKRRPLDGVLTFKSPFNF